MKRLASLLLLVALTGTGCLGTRNLEAPLPPPPPAEPAPPPVLPGQVNENNVSQIIEAMNAELDYAARESTVAPAPAPLPHE
jgi:hypothetical protein